MSDVIEAAERVLDWADHHQPWNPDGAFDDLYRALGRRRPQGEEPLGPRYYFHTCDIRSVLCINHAPRDSHNRGIYSTDIAVVCEGRSYGA